VYYSIIEREAILKAKPCWLNCAGFLGEVKGCDHKCCQEQQQAAGSAYVKKLMINN
jgi:hypothetical protein